MILNLIVIALMTEFHAVQVDYQLGLRDERWANVSEQTFEAAEYVFFAIYLFDLCLRMASRAFFSLIVNLR